MPAKKAAGEAAAPPKNVKAEKPVDAPKKAQAVQQKDVPAKAVGQKPNQGAPQAAGAQPARPISSDPAEAAIQRKMNDIETKIAKYRGDLDKIKKDLEDEKITREKYFAEQKALRQQMSGHRESTQGVSKGRKDQIDQIVELKRVKKIRIEESRKIRDTLPHTGGDNKSGEKSDNKAPGGKPDNKPIGQEQYGKKIEEKIKALEKEIAENAYPLAQEKKKVEEISQLQKAKKVYKDWLGINEEINQLTLKITELESKLDETKDASQNSRAEFTKIQTGLDDLEEKIKASKTKGDKLHESRGPINDNINKLRDDFALEKEKLDNLRKKKWEETKVQREQEREKQQQIWEQKKKEREDRQAARAKVEEAKTPYEDELYHCDQLTHYLNSLLPKQQPAAAAATTAATPEASDVTILKKDDGEGEFAGKQKQKKQKATKVTQDLKHNVEIFLQFETVSLIPPAKLSDVEGSLADLQKKKEHFQKLQDTAKKEKEEKRAAEAAAEAAKKEADAAAKAEATAEPVATSNE